MGKRFLFHFSLIALAVTEVYRMYLLSPVPGSQESEMVHVSYPLWHYRWVIRGVLILAAIYSARSVFERRKWIPVITILISGFLFYAANFPLSAESMFHEVETLQFADADKCGLSEDALVISVSVGNESHAFPIRYLEFHHRVPDVVGGQSVLVTYCNVCRSALVLDPNISNGNTQFRLMGMDQFNAILEDTETGSWWMQATGECVAGEMQGTQLKTLPAQQLSLGQWRKKFPKGKVMLPDPKYAAQYGDGSFEKGTIKDELIGTDTASWQDKSWIIGIEYKNQYRAYDWNQLVRERIIQDELAGDPIVLKVDSANINFYAYRLIPNANYKNDTTQPKEVPSSLEARQMFWHTWRTFYPTTTKYPD